MSSSIQNQAQAQNQLTVFYDVNKAKIKNADVNQILLDIIASDYKKLSRNQFEVLGSLAYMYGMDFLSQKQSLNKIVMTNWVLRMKDLEMNNEILTNFEKVLVNLDFETITKTKDSLKDLLLKDCQFEFNDFQFLKQNIDSIIKSSTFKIGFSEEIREVLNSKHYTYGDLLKINKLIYEELNFQGKYFKNVIAIQGHPKYGEKISKASEFYDLQKFSIIYFDSLFSLKELLMLNLQHLQTYMNFIENDALLESIEKFETQKVVDTIDKEVSAPTELEEKSKNPEDTDAFIAGVLQEKLGKNIDGLDDYVNAIDMTSEDEDLIQYVYQFIKERLKVNRTVFAELFTFNREDLLTKLNEKYTETGDKYKSLVEAYLKEFSVDDKMKINAYLQDIIVSLVPVGTEAKSYLLQQFLENGVHTYKHLQQMLGLIEECDIVGNQINSYLNLRDFLNLNDEIKDVFESITQIDNLQTKLSFLQAIIEFYKYEPVVAEEETTK